MALLNTSLRIDQLVEMLVEELRKDGHTFALAIDDKDEMTTFWYNITEESTNPDLFVELANVLEKKRTESDK